MKIEDKLTSILGRECTVAPKEKSCYRCGLSGHISRECTQASTGSNFGGNGYSGGAGGQECYKCGQVGHIARNCPGGNYGGSHGGFGGRQQTCYSCGGYGHMARDCMQGQKCYNCMFHLFILTMCVFCLFNDPFYQVARSGMFLAIVLQKPMVNVSATNASSPAMSRLPVPTR